MLTNQTSPYLFSVALCRKARTAWGMASWSTTGDHSSALTVGICNREGKVTSWCHKMKSMIYIFASHTWDASMKVHVSSFLCHHSLEWLPGCFRNRRKSGAPLSSGWLVQEHCRIQSVHFNCFFCIRTCWYSEQQLNGDVFPSLQSFKQKEQKNFPITLLGKEGSHLTQLGDEAEQKRLRCIDHRIIVVWRLGTAGICKVTLYLFMLLYLETGISAL